jgi:hypothetical protein
LSDVTRTSTVQPADDIPCGLRANHLSRARMKLFLALAIITYPAVAGSQQLPPLNVLLDRLDAYTNQYQATLPSLSCEEQITSQALNDKGKVTREVKIQSTLREIRTGNAYDPFHEERQIKSTGRRRPKRQPDMPYFVEGGFAGLVGFKRWEQRECFDYVLKSGNDIQTVHLDMTLKQTNASCAKLPVGLHRIVIADSQTGRILHTERTIAPEIAEAGDEVYFGGIDYAPQKLGEETFWLPSSFYSHDAENTGRMIATYSNCHRYTVELKVLPGMPLTEPGKQPH